MLNTNQSNHLQRCRMGSSCVIIESRLRYYPCLLPVLTGFVMLNILLFVEFLVSCCFSFSLSFFLLAIVWSVLRFKTSVYPVRIFTFSYKEDTKRGNQNPYIEEEQTTQWPKDSKRGNQNPYIEEEQTTQWHKRTNNDLQNIHIKLKIE